MKKRGQGCPFKSTAPITTCSSKGAILGPFFLVWNCFPVWPCLNHYFWLENIPFILLSPVQTSSCLNQERSMHRSAVYKQKQTRRVLNKFRLVLWPEASVTPPGPHHHTERVSYPGCWRGRRALYQGGYRIQPLASIARAPLFEVRGVRFTHNSPYWHTSLTQWFKRLWWIRIGLPVDYCDAFISCLDSFWRHPFTTEDSLVSKWWISQNLFWWRNKLIYILDDLRTSTSLISTLNLHRTWNIPLLAYLLGISIHTPFNSL